MSNLMNDGSWFRLGQSLALRLRSLGKAAGIVAVVLSLGAVGTVSAREESLERNGCAHVAMDTTVAVVPPGSNAQAPQAFRSASLTQKPAGKGTADKKEAAKQKPAPPQPKEPVADRPEPKEPPAVPKDAEPTTADEAAKPSADADPAAKEVDEAEGPDALAQKFAELLEKRRAEAAAKAAVVKTPHGPSTKEVPKQTEPVVKPEPKPEPTPKPETEPAAEPAQDVEPSPASEDAAPISEGPPTIAVLVLQSADDLAEVPRTERIGRLILTGGTVTNRSLRALEGLTVTELSIEATRVSNAGIQHIRLVKGVHRLRLWTPEVDDTALSQLASLKFLEVLDLEGTAIQGAGLTELKGLSNLEMLVMGPKASDTQLVSLQDLPALTQLDLRSCQNLTLACLESLAQLKNLKTLWLPSHIRAKGKRVLSESLPACEVRS